MALFRIADHGTAKSSARTTRRPAERLYRASMRLRLRGADLVAFAILTVFVAVVGTGLGVAAARVRASDSARHGPAAGDPPTAGNDVPSIQRDRIRLRHAR